MPAPTTFPEDIEYKLHLSEGASRSWKSPTIRERRRKGMVKAWRKRKRAARADKE